ncbi:hypothetical protein NM688_g4310 [Phlebia brevispora]|uniref:Uncharacterized protein n=1 Tax=Phlebia brevispora TaxID=194682 RepID=A0ACC1T302_9APHY|nr:hypothetical protein NM688_g4310 [Phlebia brevispora]
MSTVENWAFSPARPEEPSRPKGISGDDVLQHDISAFPWSKPRFLEDPFREGGRGIDPSNFTAAALGMDGVNRDKNTDGGHEKWRPCVRKRRLESALPNPSLPLYRSPSESARSLFNDSRGSLPSSTPQEPCSSSRPTVPRFSRQVGLLCCVLRPLSIDPRLEPRTRTSSTPLHLRGGLFYS